MAYNRVNKLRTYQLVLNIVKQHYIEGITTYKGIFEAHVRPIYPMSYQRFITIINTPNIEKTIASECERLGKEIPGRRIEDKHQLKLFENEQN